jgi:hypothetical protein
MAVLYVYDKDGNKIPIPALSKPTPDLTQNDETAPDYVKGRTHWVESEVVFPETTAIVEEDVAYFDSDFSPEIGETYYVNYCGTNYTCVAFDLGGIGGIGNPYYFEVGEDNGLPFAFMNEGGFGGIIVDGKTEITLEIKTEGVVKLPAKYAPCYVLNLKSEDIAASDGTNVKYAYPSGDATALLEALINGVPVYIDLTEISSGYAKRISVMGYSSPVPYSLSALLTLVGSTAQINLFGVDYSSNSNGELWRIMFNIAKS